MSETAPGAMGPNEHHERLLARVGEWKVDCKYFMNPAEDPIQTVGTDRVAALGGYWTTGHFECDVMGTSIVGLSTTGFDPKKNLYVGTWQDSSNPYHYYFEGGFDEESGVLTMEGQNVDPMSGAMVNYRSVETFGDDVRKLELFIEYEEDKIIKILEYDYTRA